MNKIPREFHICLFFILLLLVGCGVNQTTQPGVDLQIASFTADKNEMIAEIVNNGIAPAGSFTMEFSQDEIYIENTVKRYCTVESLAVGATVTIVQINDLISAEGQGQHYARISVDYDDRLAESDETNNQETLEFYTGENLAGYTLMMSLLTGWQSEIRTQLSNDYGFACTGSVYLRFQDEISGDMAGYMATPHLFGSIESTPVITVDLTKAQQGYSTYESEGVIYQSITSKEVIFHEYTHAYHWHQVNDNNGQWPPAWFREGFAVYVTGNGERTLKRLISRSKASGEAEAETVARILDGFEDLSHDAYDYGEDYLALAYIVANFGFEALKNIVEDNATGSSIESAVVNNLAGIDNFADFENVVYLYGRSSIETYYPLVN
ncbi:MAG: CARDB domain-containing protein [bacterium]